MVHKAFGGYIHYPGGCHCMGLISWNPGYEGPLFHDDPKAIVYLGKKRHMPNEEFVFCLRPMGKTCFSLYLSLVPEVPLRRYIAAVLTFAALLLGRARIDLWGGHQWTGGPHDFCGNGACLYSIREDWQ